MLSFLPSWLLIFITVPLFFGNTIIVGGSIFLVGLVKFFLPIKPITALLNILLHGLWRLWAIFNLLATNLTNPVDWQINSKDKYDKKGWYLLISNHLSWVDIMVITQLALDRLPSPRFFLKSELKKMPFVGMAAWALDMPFMKRYSRSYLERHPEKKGQDIEVTKRSCEKFKDIPTTIINFVEGTRFSQQKQQQSGSKFRHLLNPKAGGIAFTLASMGHLFSGVINVSLNYPDNEKPAMDLLLGRLKRVQVEVELLEVDHNIVGDYFNDEDFKTKFQSWLNELWLKKDKILQQFNS